MGKQYCILFLLNQIKLSSICLLISPYLFALLGVPLFFPVDWKGALTCEKSDCNCTFNQQRGCCCAASDMFQLEEDILGRMKFLWHDISTLKGRVQSLTGEHPCLLNSKCFEAIDLCFPFSSVLLNSGNGYNPSLGIFTAPFPGVYVFSFTTYSSVGENGRLYHKVQLMKNGKRGASVWENNREDTEDSATQVVALEMQRGDQVYLDLMSGRKLCTNLQYNVFTGYILYPYIAA
uniref:Cerebellin 18 n=1 Tax=Neolamprologus brichardi TaxID=32507 RepID=A0A3Q4G090_NEOBR